MESLGEGVGKSEAEGDFVPQETLAPFEGLVAALPVDEPQRVRVGETVARVVSVLDREEVRQVEGVTERVVDWEGEADRERVCFTVLVTKEDKVTLAAVAVGARAVEVRKDDGEEDKDDDPETEGVI